ncbi:hypothetical protein HanPSC8_Chr03g0099251 [Helianthus annuus]|nr:hypothetical protein HanPSC8_Chr03g0099251 [Helianthus annuus]
MDLKQKILLQHSPTFSPRFVCSSWSGCDTLFKSQAPLFIPEIGPARESRRDPLPLSRVAGHTPLV